MKKIKKLDWDECNFCHKIDDPLVDANVTDMVRYRSGSSVNCSPDRFRVVMDFNYIDNLRLYNKLKRKRNEN